MYFYIVRSKKMLTQMITRDYDGFLMPKRRRCPENLEETELTLFYQTV